MTSAVVGTLCVQVEGYRGRVIIPPFKAENTFSQQSEIVLKLEVFTTDHCQK